MKTSGEIEHILKVGTTKLCTPNQIIQQPKRNIDFRLYYAGGNIRMEIITY